MWNFNKLVFPALATVSIFSCLASDDQQPPYRNPHPSQEQVQVINHGVAALEKRFEMIENAKDKIDVEYFIYNLDEAGRLFAQALLRKKQESPWVKIRVLLDASETILQMDEAHIAAFAAHGIEVRLYNTASLWTRFKDAQFRDHRKLLAVDGKEAITGSRNIADEYFDLSPEFNFRDRDIYLKGPLAADMAFDFERYWDHPLAERFPQTNQTDKTLFFQANEADKRMGVAVRKLGQKILANRDSVGRCDTLTQVSDLPGYANAANRPVLSAIYRGVESVEPNSSIYLESPYFILTADEAIRHMKMLKEKNIRSYLLTNSLASTDAFYVAANFNQKVKFYSGLADTEMHTYEGKMPTRDATSYYPVIYNMSHKPITENALWGIHAKTFVFGDDEFAIGTFNADPRSANLNSEMMVFCKGDKSLTKFIVDDIKTRINQSEIIAKNGAPVSAKKSIYEGVSRKNRLGYLISKKPSVWFESMF